MLYEIKSDNYVTYLPIHEWKGLPIKHAGSIIHQRKEL